MIRLPFAEHQQHDRNGFRIAPDGSGLEHDQSTEETRPIYVLLTDTGTFFSKVSKAITRQPYNHVSLSFSEDLKGDIYAYNISADGFGGGLRKESLNELKGARFTLYRADIPVSSFLSIHERVVSMFDERHKTRYNHLGLLNAIFKKGVVENATEGEMICSQFIVEVFKSASVDLFPRVKVTSTIRPYDLVRARLLKHVRRGTL